MSLTPAAAKRLADELLAPDASLSDAPSGTGENPGMAVGADSPAISSANRVIGRYRILHLLGAGGMGEVLRAVQDNPQREVALKLVRPELVSAEARRRFEHEARILARLQHPGIAQIFDAGEAQTDAGPRPYFAMELVEGQPLTEYASRHKLSTRQRLDLFLKICDAVEHAHRKGVIHRDLKPGNILVNAAGQPKILDFGVARATDADVQVTTLRTDIGKLVGTIPYMSPEQAMGGAGGGDDLDTRSDVYALGVVLYELLSGQLPYQISRASIPEAVRVIKEEEPRPLSSINRTFRGDLETIVAKALEKERERRYASVGELAGDVRRYLRDEPIVARPASAAYNLKKFARRNRTIAAAGSAVVVVVVAGAIVAGWFALAESRARMMAEAANSSEREHRRVADEKAQEAREQSEVALAAIDFLVDDLLGELDPSMGGHDVRVRDVLDSAAAAVDGRFANSPKARATVRFALGSMYHRLGLDSRAETELAEALRIFVERTGPESSDSARAMNMLAEALRLNDKLIEAEELHRRCFQLRRRILGACAEDTLVSQSNWANTLLQMGRVEAAEAELARVGEMARATLGADHRRTLHFAACLADVYAEQGRLDEADVTARAALDAARNLLGNDHPSVIGGDHNYAMLLHERGQLREADALFTSVVERATRILGPNYSLVPMAMIGRCRILVQTGRMREAAPLIRDACERLTNRLGRDNSVTMSGLTWLVTIAKAEGNFGEAARLQREIVECYVRTLGETHLQTLNAYNGIVNVLDAAGEFQEAERLSAENLARATTALGIDHPMRLNTLQNRAYVLLDCDRLPEAEAAARELLNARKRTRGPHAPETIDATRLVAGILVRQQQHQTAIDLLQSTLGDVSLRLSDDQPPIITLRLTLAWSLAAAGRFGEAEAVYREAESELNPAGPLRPLWQDLQRGLIKLYDRSGDVEKAQLHRRILDEVSSDSESPGPGTAPPRPRQTPADES